MKKVSKEKIKEAIRKIEKTQAESEIKSWGQNHSGEKRRLNNTKYK